MTDDEKRLVREAADRMFQITRQSHDDVAWEHALRPMLDEMARLTESRIEAERRENEARTDREVMREQRQQSLTAATRAAGEIVAAHERLSRVKVAVVALHGAWKDGMIEGVDRALAAVDRALAGDSD